jgi:hypothetical protein
MYVAAGDREDCLRIPERSWIRSREHALLHRAYHVDVPQSAIGSRGNMPDSALEFGFV